jgi:hypothetical protein
MKNFYNYFKKEKRVGVIPQSLPRLNRGGLPSETLESGSLKAGELVGGAEEAV